MLVTDVLGRIGENPDRAEIERVLRESIRAAGNLIPSSFARRPVEVRVAVEDEEGCEVDQTVALTRAQGGTPTVLGGTLGNLVASVLGSFYVAADGAEYGDALDAALVTLQARQ
ncbi:hypothetical protein GCM10023201_41210 [Actinomycetospora corticicola]